MIRILALLAALVCVAPAIAQPLPANLDKQNAIVIDTTKGRIVIKLRTDLAPKHAERIKQLARDGYLQQRAVPPRDGRLHGADRRRPEFQRHRRIEISEPEGRNSPTCTFKRGIVGMARRGDSVDSANSQFFIMFADGVEPERPVHRGRRSGVGHGRGRQAQEGAAGSAGGAVTDPDKMVKVQVASDIK